MVSIKHKVTIKTKTAQVETPPEVENPVVTLEREQPEVAVEIKSEVKPKPTKVTPPTSEPEKKSNTGKIVGGIAAVAAILAGVYFFGIKGEEATVNNDSETPTPASVEANGTPASGDNPNTTTPTKADGEQAEKPFTAENPATNSEQTAQPNPSSSTSTKQSTTDSVSGDVVENAKRVIRGDFGVGKERKNKLGSAYSEIQSKVNEMYRQGLVH